MVISLRVTGSAKRADLYLSEKLSVSRNQIQRLIEDHYLLLDGKPFKPSVSLKQGVLISGEIPEATESNELVARPIPLKILYEDKYIIVIDKEKGVVVHPAHGHADDTMVNALLHHCKDLKGIGGILRPGVVHRLDKDTAGVIVFAKDEASLNALQRQFKAREVVKEYRLVVWGVPAKEQDTIMTGIGRSMKDRKKFAVTKQGREAITQYRVLKSTGGVSLVEATIKTGRTHQIRVHMEHIGTPVIGDPQYNRKNSRFVIKDAELLGLANSLNGQALCAWHLSFAHPATGEQMSFYGTIPPDMQRLITWIEEHAAR